MKKFIYKNALITRIFFALLIVGLILPIIFTTFYGGKPGRIIGSIAYILLGMLGYYELLRVLKVSKISSLITTLVIPAFVLLKFDIYQNLVDHPDGIISDGIFGGLKYWETWLISIIFIIVPFISDLVLYEKKPKLFPFIIIIFMSFMIPLFVKGIWIMNMYGISYVIFFIGIAICSDTFSYFGGMFFGKKLFKGAKFAPIVSPKKTWAGYVIGSTLTAFYAVLVGYFGGIWEAFGDFELSTAIVFGLWIAFATPYGDLFFSLIKRKQKVKDFSNLIPGHGGVFDRVDAMSFVISISTLVFLFVNIS